MSLPAEGVCCDPLKCHKKPKRKGLRTVPHAIIAAHPSLHLTRHHFICTMCHKQLKFQAASTSPDDTADTFPADLGDSELESGATADISPASDISDIDSSKSCPSRLRQKGKEVKVRQCRWFICSINE